MSASGGGDQFDSTFEDPGEKFDSLVSLEKLPNILSGAVAGASEDGALRVIRWIARVAFSRSLRGERRAIDILRLLRKMLAKVQWEEVKDFLKTQANDRRSLKVLYEAISKKIDSSSQHNVRKELQELLHELRGLEVESLSASILLPSLETKVECVRELLRGRVRRLIAFDPGFGMIRAVGVTLDRSTLVTPAHVIACGPGRMMIVNYDCLGASEPLDSTRLAIASVPKADGNDEFDDLALVRTCTPSLDLDIILKEMSISEGKHGFIATPPLGFADEDYDESLSIYPVLVLDLTPDTFSRPTPLVERDEDHVLGSDEESLLERIRHSIETESAKFVRLDIVGEDNPTLLAHGMSGAPVILGPDEDLSGPCVVALLIWVSEDGKSGIGVRLHPSRVRSGVSILDELSKADSSSDCLQRARENGWAIVVDLEANARLVLDPQLPLVACVGALGTVVAASSLWNSNSSGVWHQLAYDALIGGGVAALGACWALSKYFLFQNPFTLPTSTIHRYRTSDGLAVLIDGYCLIPALRGQGVFPSIFDSSSADTRQYHSRRYHGVVSTLYKRGNATAAAAAAAASSFASDHFNNAGAQVQAVGASIRQQTQVSHALYVAGLAFEAAYNNNPVACLVDFYTRLQKHAHLSFHSHCPLGLNTHGAACRINPTIKYCSIRLSYLDRQSGLSILPSFTSDEATDEQGLLRYVNGVQSSPYRLYEAHPHREWNNLNKTRHVKRFYTVSDGNKGAVAGICDWLFENCYAIGCGHLQAVPYPTNVNTDSITQTHDLNLGDVNQDL